MTRWQEWRAWRRYARWRRRNFAGYWTRNADGSIIWHRR